MKAKKGSAVKTFFRRACKVIVYGFILSLIYLLICKWLMPPITFTQLTNWIGGYGLKRDYVSWNDISPNIKLAAISSEDQLFAIHHGFDWKSIDKSLDSDPSKTGRAKGSATSTISQQTAKNVFLFQGASYIRKPFEAVYTVLIELIWGKQRILEVYLNTIEMGKGIFGIEAASEQYFHKHAKDLSRNEAAMIISCLPNPKIYTVKPESRFIAWKSNWILRQMNNMQTDKNVIALINKK